MKIKYRKPTIIEQMSEAIENKSKYIESFEITEKEFNQFYSTFDKTVDRQGNNNYSYKGITVKVKNEN